MKGVALRVEGEGRRSREVNTTHLAWLCSQVAKYSGFDDATREKARTLNTEWRALQTTPLPGEKKKHDEKVAANRRNMVDFLTELLK